MISQKGNRVPVINDYIYRHKSTGSNGNGYCKCSIASCNARAVTSNGELLRTRGDRMRNIDFNNILKSQIKDIIIARLADSSFVSANELYEGTIRSLCDSYGSRMDTMIHIVFFDSLKISIYR
jgi:hypothetical protein